MRANSFTVEPVSNAVGALESGVDLSDLDDTALESLRTAFADHGVLFFRDQNLSPEIG